MVTPRDDRAEERDRRRENLDRVERVREEVGQINRQLNIGEVNCDGGDDAPVGENEMETERQEPENMQNGINENENGNNLNHELPRTGQNNFQGTSNALPGTSSSVGQWELMMQYMINENRIRNEQIQRRDQTIDILIEQIQGLTQSVLPNARSTPRAHEETIVACQVMPDLTKNIEKFDGEADIVSAQTWLQSIESMCHLHRWSEEYALDLAKMNLVGGAKRWLNARMDEIKNWSQFKTAFESTFYIKENMSTRWQRMASRLQQRGETSSTYFHEKYDLCRQLKLSFDETKEMILTGLWVRDAANSLMGCRHLDSNDLLHDILKFERMCSSRTSQDKFKSNEFHPSVFQTKRNENPDSVIRPRITKEIVCYNCRKGGHLSRNCPEQRMSPTCFQCGQKEHISRTCPNQQGAIRQLDGLPQNGIAKYLKTVYVGDSKLSAFVDMGSSECTIRATTALLNGFNIQCGLMELKSFGPAEFKVISPGWIVTSLSVDGALAENITFRVVPDEVQKWDVLVGRTYTELPYISYSKVDNLLQFTSKVETQPFAEFSYADRQVSTWKAQETTIPTGSISFISAVQGESQIVLPIANISEEDVTIGVICNIETGITKDEKQCPRSVIELVDINVDADNVSHETLRELLDILNSFRDCVALDACEIGCTKEFNMEIQETPGCKPPYSKPYPASDIEKKNMRDIIDGWRKLGIVTDTNSSYASPVLLVKKKTGESRLVVDFRKLNNQTVKINFPLPNMDDHIGMLGDSKVFIVLDLAQGFLQLPIHPRDRHKTAFITPEDTGEFTRMIFGLTNGPFYFAKLMQRVLGPLRNRVVFFYLDDIFIPGQNWEDLKERLVLVFKALRKGGLTVRLSKCEFLKKRVTYLGFQISEKGIEPSQNKVQAIKGFPQPRNVHEVRRFLGLVGFFRRFIEKFATRAAPLYDILKINNKFDWSVAAEEAFTGLKNALTSEPILQLFDPRKRTELHSDASSQGLAAMLFQRGSNDDQRHLVYAISRRTTDAEKSYHSSKLELLAVVWALTRLRFLLINVNFTIITDCQALIYLNVQKTRNPQVCRWYNLLCEFNFKIEHRSGVKLQHVDALSRAPNEEAPCSEDLEERTYVFQVTTDEDEVIMYQFQDERIQRKIDILRNKKSSMYTGFEKCEVNGYTLENGILYKIESNQHKFVIPKTMRKAITIRFHDLQGHFGSDRTLSKMKRFYYFPGMRQYVKQHINACLHCLLSKTQTGKPAGELHPIPPGNRPFAVVHLDHLGPFISSTKGNKYILVIICNLTKFVKLEAVRNTNAENVVRRLENFVTEFGAPEKFVTDRGSCFTSSSFEQFCQKHGIQHHLNSPRHAQANGQVERVNRTLVPTIIATLDESKEGKDWDKKLKNVARDLNNSDNKTTGKSPFQLLYGYTPRFDEGYLRHLTISEESKNYQRPENLRDEAVYRILTEQRKYKERYDRNRRINVQYDLGDIVFMKTSPQSTGDSTKLHRKNRGPLVVTKILPNDTYGIAALRCVESGRKYSSTAHISQLKLWKAPDDDGGNDEIVADKECAFLRKTDNDKHPQEDSRIDITNNELMTATGIAKQQRVRKRVQFKDFEYY